MDNLESVIWAVVVALTLVGEVLTMSFFLLFFAFGAVVGLVLAFVGVSLPVQIAGFIVASVLSMVVLRPAILNRLALRGGERYERRNTIAGRGAVVTSDIEPDGSGMVQIGGGEFWTARAAYSGQRIERGVRVRVLDTDGVAALVVVAEGEERSG